MRKKEKKWDFIIVVVAAVIAIIVSFAVHTINEQLSINEKKHHFYIFY